MRPTPACSAFERGCACSIAGVSSRPRLPGLRPLNINCFSPFADTGTHEGPRLVKSPTTCYFVTIQSSDSSTERKRWG